MDYFFITSILGLDCPTLPRSGIEIAPNMRLSTDVEHLLNNRISRTTYDAMGGLDKAELQTEQCFVVARKEPPSGMDMNPRSPNASVTHLALLNRLLYQLEIWSFGMWCIRDNCINSGTAFLEYPYKSPDAQLSQNTFGLRTSMTDGKKRKTQFDKDELQYPKKLFQQDSPIDERIRLTVEDGVHGNASLPGDVLEKYATANRQQKAMGFIHMARGQELLPYKIAMYVAAMECLFSTRSDSDATEQIATRIAVMLDSYTKFAGMEIYDGVKKAYNVRSRFIHGGVMTKRELSTLPDISLQCDQYLRYLLPITIRNPDVRKALDDEKTLRELFLNKMFQPISEPDDPS